MIEAIGPVRALVGEAPVWDGGRLLWVDVPGGHVHRTDLASGDTETTALGPPVSFVWPTPGGTLAARGLDLLLDGRTVATVPAGPGEDRCNDGVVDGEGRVWIGTMGSPGAARLYRLDPSGGGPTPVLDGLTVSNGIRFSPDGTRLYLVDTPTGRVDVLDVDPSGGLSGRRVFAEIPGPGKPDGIAVDDDGRVWVAVWNGGAVLAHTPDGVLSERVDLPVAYPTSCAFVGKRLLVTTASRPLGDQAGPLDGALLEVVR
ncbi:SMP-30/gluconolactonase/LRE family protein [Actinomadura harenae]|uniref:SMP-30/gluconolactonase/LRE family protein n=1 Tax=Actinomadura harenae TaxID=2483351 RepID=A0A3M2M2L5_9ACTN|nr:SMP-30/gluconolactonase/LRE family protein [Actinomadura harenae]RMI43642.1 SMP-30/gluconolactonase/LRE family protein [Actinomadura harenae]